jgi:hypothetical protein
MGCLIILLLCLVSGPRPAFGETASGFVFEDRNNNGSFDRGETGLEGIQVSNGRDVVATDETGRYALSVQDGDILFVVKPRDYALPVNAYNLPEFYHIHKPQGTPASLALRYRGIEPTGPLPGQIDFPLLRAPEPDRFKVVLFADTQPQTSAELGYIRDKVVSELIGTDAAFGITAGDIMFDDLSMIPRYNSIIGQIGIPWFNVPGNHELNLLSPDDRNSLETFRRYYGPPNYSFNYGSVHFVILDDVHYFGSNTERDPESGAVRKRKIPDARGKGVYEGRLSTTQLQWLRQDLNHVDQDKLVVLVMHIPLVCPGDPERPNVNLVNRDALLEILCKRRHLLSLSGHTHTNEHLLLGPRHCPGKSKPLHHHTLATVSGSWWSGPQNADGLPLAVQSDGVPNGYHIMTVDGNRATIRYKAAGLDPDHQMRIVLDADFHREDAASIRDYRHGALLHGPISVDQLYAAQVVVNLFNGGPHSVVTLRVGERDPETMEQFRGADPTSVELIHRFRDQYKYWVEARPTGHLWKCRLPTDLDPGTHILTVEATDQYGHNFTAHKIIEVVGHGR